MREERPNIRGSFWGDSPENVRQAELKIRPRWKPLDKGRLKISDETKEYYLRFQGSLFDIHCILKYVFSSDEEKLCRMEFVISPPANNEIDLWEKAEDALVCKYDNAVQNAESPPGLYLNQKYYGSRRVVHDDNQFVNGQTVIESFLYEQKKHMYAVKILMWKNGDGGTTPQYKKEWIDEDRRQTRLKKQAIEQF